MACTEFDKECSEAPKTSSDKSGLAGDLLDASGTAMVKSMRDIAGASAPLSCLPDVGICFAEGPKTSGLTASSERLDSFPDNLQKADVQSAPSSSNPLKYDVAVSDSVTRSAHVDESGVLRSITVDAAGRESTSLTSDAWSALKPGEARNVGSQWSVFRPNGADSSNPDNVLITNRDGTTFVADAASGRLTGMYKPGDQHLHSVVESPVPGIDKITTGTGTHDYRIGTDPIRQSTAQTDKDGNLTSIRTFADGIGRTITPDMWTGREHMPPGWSAFTDPSGERRTVIQHTNGTTLSVSSEGRLLVLHPPGTNRAPHYVTGH